MDLRQMEYLVTLADEQQFTRAAAICGVSQSGLSAAIRALENELGTPLFHRTTRRVEVTDAGRALLPHARSMLAQASAARDAVDRATHELTGRLHIGTEQCLGMVDVTALLERVHLRHPLVELEFTQAGSHDLASAVREGEMDVAFVAVTEHLGTLHRSEIGRQPLVLLAPPGHPLSRLTQPTWRDLADADFVDFQTSWAVRSLNDEAFASRGVARRVRCSVGDVHTLLDLVQRGLGVAIVPAHVAGKPQAAGLAVLPAPSGAPAWIVSAVAASPGAASTSLVLELLRGETLAA